MEKISRNENVTIEYLHNEISDLNMKYTHLMKENEEYKINVRELIKIYDQNKSQLLEQQIQMETQEKITNLKIEELETEQLEKEVLHLQIEESLRKEIRILKEIKIQFFEDNLNLKTKNENLQQQLDLLLITVPQQEQQKKKTKKKSSISSKDSTTNEKEGKKTLKPKEDLAKLLQDFKLEADKKFQDQEEKHQGLKNKIQEQDNTIKEQDTKIKEQNTIIKYQETRINQLLNEKQFQSDTQS